MSQNANSLKILSREFQSFAHNLNAPDQVDYHFSPVTRHTNWDFIQPDSLRTVYSTRGPNAPDIETRQDVDLMGTVLTFDTPVGGDDQIFLNDSIAAFRKIGSPAGWAYLGLDPNQKIYMDDDAADVFERIADHIQYHDYVDTDSDQNIQGHKNFTEMPTFRNQPLVFHSEFRKLLGYRNDDARRISNLLNNYRTIRGMVQDYENNLSDFQDQISENYATQDMLSDYAPLSQLNFYATKKDVSNFLTDDNLANVLDDYATQDELSQFAKKTTVDEIGKEVSTDLKIATANKHNIDTKTNFDDFEALRRLVRRINRRTGEVPDQIGYLQNSAEDNASNIASNTSDINSLATNGNITRANASYQASSLNSGLNEVASSANTNHDETLQSFADSQAMLDSVYTHKSETQAFFNQAEYDATSQAQTLQAEIYEDSESYQSSINSTKLDQQNISSRISANASNIYDIKKQSKRADKRNDDAIKNQSNVNASQSTELSQHAGSLNALANSMSTAYGTMPSGIRTNANMINADADSLTELKQGVSANHTSYTSLSNSVSVANSSSAVVNHSNVASLSTGVSKNASRLNSDATDLYKIKQDNRKNKRITGDALGSLNSRAGVDEANIQANSKAITSIKNGMNTAGISNNASRINASAADLWKLKQAFKRANKRNTDAINSLSANHSTGAPVGQVGLNSLSNSTATTSNQVATAINSLATNIKSLANTSAEAKIEKIKQSAASVENSQKNVNTSLSNAVQAQSTENSNTNSVLSDLVSDLSD